MWMASGSSSTNPKEDALRIYNAGHKPVIFADYIEANPDSPLSFKSRIEKITYDPAKKSTIIYGPDIHWKLRPPRFIEFPDNEELAKAAALRNIASHHPRPTAVHWNTLVVPGNYTPYVKVGQMVARSTGAMAATQEERARQMIEAYDSVLNLKGDDGNYCVLGIEHWCMNDDGVNNGSETENLGIATLMDNAYDGKEARRAAVKDAQGRDCGGEDADYGNLLGPLANTSVRYHRRSRNR